VSHGNARTTVYARKLIVQRHQAGWAQARIAEQLGVSRPTVSKWIARYRDEGVAGLQDRPSRPHRCPARTSRGVEEKILLLRSKVRRGAMFLAGERGLVASTVGRVLARHQVPRRRRPAPGSGRLDPPVRFGGGVRLLYRHRADRRVVRRRCSAPVVLGGGSATELRAARHGDHSDPSRHPGRAYYRRKRAAGKSHKEALRCLKRRLSDVVYRQLLRDAQAAGPGEHPGATLQSSAAGSTLTADLSDKSLPGPTTTQPTAAGK
jgi:transposase